MLVTTLRIYNICIQYDLVSWEGKFWFNFKYFESLCRQSGAITCWDWFRLTRFGTEHSFQPFRVWQPVRFTNPQDQIIPWFILNELYALTCSKLILDITLCSNMVSSRDRNDFYLSNKPRSRARCVIEQAEVGIEKCNIVYRI